MASVKSSTTPQGAQEIQKLPVQSSWIAAFEYDPAQMRLTTHLKDGSIHQHVFVTGMDWTLLQTSKSKGQHWAANIKGKKTGIRIKSAKQPNSEIKLGGGRK